METPIPNNIHENAAVATSDLQSNGKMTPERVYGANGSAARKAKVPVTATSYTVAALQVATNSFCQDSLLGEGSLGRVYKADFPNGKVIIAYSIFLTSLKTLSCIFFCIIGYILPNINIFTEHYCLHSHAFISSCFTVTLKLNCAL